MSALEAALRLVTAQLTDAGVPFALVGGLAVSVRVEPRFTRDADLAVTVATDDEAESLTRRLSDRGCHVTAIVEQESTGRLATVRLVVARDPRSPVVDLLFASSGIESEVVAEAEPLALLDGVQLPVARTGHLIALKVLSRDDERRPQDLVDLRGLVRKATPVEIARSRNAIALITARGYSRGRDLVAELSRVLPQDS